MEKGTVPNSHFQKMGNRNRPHFPKNEGGKQMKATGVVRRIDDLGRVVIQKEIRKTLQIKEGEPLLPSLEVLYNLEISLKMLIYQYKECKSMNTYRKR